MGCFNVSCGASHLTINSGNKIVLFPLTMRGFIAKMNPYRNCANFITNDGPFGICHPYTLPIFGEYNDYGCLENIEENEHTKHLEKHFGTSIQNIADYFCRADCEGDDMIVNFKKKSAMKNIAGMFVLREVYDEYVEASLKTLKMNFYAQAPMTSNTLELMGFKFVEEIEQGRYTSIYKHPSSKEYVAMCDGSFTHIGKVLKKGKYTEVSTFTYNPCYVHTEWERITGQKTNWDKLKDISLYQYEALNMHKHYKKYECLDSMEDLENQITDLSKDKEANANIIAKLTTKLCMAMEKKYGSRTGGFERFWETRFIEVYEPLFTKKYKCVEKMINDYHLFHHIMFASNKLFIPTMGGFQGGCKEGDIAVNEIALKVAQKRQQQWLDDNTCSVCKGIDDECTCD